MSWFKRRARPSPGFTRAEALACVPLKNPRVDTRNGEAGDLMLVYPVTVKPWFAALSRRLGLEGEREQLKKLQLDEMGTVTWKLVDGASSVGQIVERFARKYRLHPREAEVAVTRFLRELGRRGLIALQ